MAILNLPDVPDKALKAFAHDYLERLTKLVTYIIDDDLPLQHIERFTYASNWSEETYEICKASADFVHELVAQDIIRNRTICAKCEKNEKAVIPIKGWGEWNGQPLCIKCFEEVEKEWTTKL